MSKLLSRICYPDTEVSWDDGKTWNLLYTPIGRAGSLSFEPKLMTATGGSGGACAPRPDPFGDAVRAAQARENAVIPHPVQPVPAEDRDALWRSIEEYGRGG